LKILLLGDLHLRYKGPSSRKDDFFQTQFNKFTQVVNIYREEGCELFLQAGDFFDNPKPPNFLMARYISLLKEREIVVCSVLGQHDVSMHNLGSAERSAVNVFRSSGVMHTLSSSGMKIGGLDIYGCSWKENVPTPQRNSRAILVIHEMIGDRPLYPGHQPIRPKSFLHTHSGYELILCGDYHYSFFAKEGNRKIVNCGALVRLNTKVTDLEIEPQVAIYDTETRELTFRKLKFAPSEEVFRLNSEKREEKEASIVEFVERLKGQMDVTVSFRDNLLRYFEEKGVESSVKGHILEVLEEVGVKVG